MRFCSDSPTFKWNFASGGDFLLFFFLKNESLKALRRNIFHVRIMEQELNRGFLWLNTVPLFFNHVIDKLVSSD